MYIIYNSIYYWFDGNIVYYPFFIRTLITPNYVLIHLLISISFLMSDLAQHLVISDALRVAKEQLQIILLCQGINFTGYGVRFHNPVQECNLHLRWKFMFISSITNELNIFVNLFIVKYNISALLLTSRKFFISNLISRFQIYYNFLKEN